MKKIQTTKNLITRRHLEIFASVLGILAIVLLAASINSLKLKPGVGFESSIQETMVQMFPDTGKQSWLLNLVLTVVLAFFPISVIAIIFSRNIRKQLKKYMLPMLLLVGYFLVIHLLSTAAAPEDPSEELDVPRPTQSDVIDLDLVQEDGASPQQVYIPPEVPHWQGYVIGFLTVVGLGYLGFKLWESSRPEEDILSGIALKALRDLSDGKHWEDTVIQCYADMSAAVSRQRRLDRSISMTPQEFLFNLQNAGLPLEPLQKLTQLFESARYSNRQSDNTARNEALESLTAILHSLEEAH